MNKTKSLKSDQDDSHEAIENVNMPRDQQAVLFALYMEGEASDEGIFAELEHPPFDDEHMPHGTAQSLCNSRAELMRDGYIEVVTYDDGTPIYDETTCHSNCLIYRLTYQGHKLAWQLF